MNILVSGAIFVDIKGYPFDNFDPKGRNSGKVEYVHGGVMRNVAEDIANCGGKVSLLSLLDDSSVSFGVLNRLKEKKINTKFVNVTQDGLGIWLAVFDENGDVYSSISKRPVLLPLVDIIEENYQEIFKDIDCIALDLSDEKEVLKTIIKYANLYHIPIYAGVSNMSIAMENLDLLSSITCFVCNQEEAGILFSKDTLSFTREKMLALVADKINDLPLNELVITLGASGSCYGSKKDGCGLSDAIFAEVVDTTGAGDAFFAGVIYSLVNEHSLQSACEVGSYLAAHTINIYDNVCPTLDLKEFGL